MGNGRRGAGGEALSDDDDGLAGWQRRSDDDRDGGGRDVQRPGLSCVSVHPAAQQTISVAGVRLCVCVRFQCIV